MQVKRIHNSKNRSTMKKYDVVVIGAGPCGLALAGHLARKGINTLVIEKEEIGEKSRSWITWYDEMVRRGFKNAIINKIGTLEFRSYLGASYDFKHSEAAIVDTKKILFALKALAVKAGAEIAEKESFIAVDNAKEGLYIRTNKGRYAAAYCADCSGAGSAMQAEYGAPLEKKGSMGCYALEFEGTRVEDEKKAVIFESAFPGRNYFWMLPHSGTSALVGCFFFEELNARTLRRAKASLEKYIGLKKITGKITRVIKGNIPLDGRRYFSKGRVFFCGDAASSPLPSSGYGLIRAMDEAKILAKAIKRGLKKGKFDYDKTVALERYPGFELHYLISDILKNITEPVLDKAIRALNDNEQKFVDDFMRGSDLSVIFVVKALKAIFSAFSPAELAGIAMQRNYKEFVMRVAREYPRATPEMTANMLKWLRKKGMKDIIRAVVD